MKPFAMLEASLADHRLNRRRFLKWGTLAAGLSFIPRSAVASRSLFQPPPNPPEKSVALYNTHTGESLNAVYWVQGEYLPEALTAVDHVLRDHRTDEIKPIDPQLVDLLHAISETLECHHPYYIISGYRSPATNAYLRAVRRGVAEYSLHMDGKAVDLRLPGWASATVRRVAMELRMGGVGYYPRSNFVHVDVGPVRYW